MNHYTNDYTLKSGCLPQPAYEDMELRGRRRRARR